MRKLCLTMLLCLLSALRAGAQIIQTYAGGGPNSGVATSININSPQAVVVDGSGNIYVAAAPVQGRVFKVDPSGQLTTVAGNGIRSFSGDGGPATSASLISPIGLALDAAGNLFIADSGSNRIRRVDGGTGIITTVAGNGSNGFSGDGGPATSAGLSGLYGVAVDGSGNLFIADASNQRIRRVEGGTGIITTVAGNGSNGFSGDGGPATSASLFNPVGVAVDGSGNLFIADVSNQRIRRVDGGTGIITTVAGNGSNGFSGDGGPATSASLFNPFGVAVDGSGNLFIADVANDDVRRVDGGTGIITTVAGNGSGNFSFSGDGGPATSADLSTPVSVAVDGSGNLLFADSGNNRIRRVDSNTGIIITVAGNGTLGFSGDGGAATNASLFRPISVAVDGSGNLLFADPGNNRVRRMDKNAGIVTTVAGNGDSDFSGDGGAATNASLYFPEGVVVDGSGNLFIADSNQFIRRVDAVTGIITTVAGNGTYGFSGDGGVATSASIANPTGIALDGSGNLFIADNANSRIRRVDGGTGIITTVAGNGTAGFSGDGGAATSASLDFPSGVAVDSTGNLFIADPGNFRVRRVDGSTAIITTVAGNGSSRFSGDGGTATSAGMSPLGISLDGSGNLLIADVSNNRIRRMDRGTGIIATVAGNGTFGFSGDGGIATSASLANPSAVVVDSSGSLFIADTKNNRIRRVSSSSVNTPAGAAVAVPLNGGATIAGGASTTFTNVISAGTTNITTSGSGPAPPAGFLLGSPAVYSSLTTTATFSGSITVCINYTGITFSSSPQLFHFEGGSWTNVTVSVDTVNQIVCGAVSSLSPFTIFQQCSKPPTLSVSLSPNVLWPPNGKLVAISANIQATDVCDPHPTVDLVSITANEALAPGDIQGAVLGAYTLSFKLSATRLGSGTGRVYTVTYQAKDIAGNSSLASATVIVPHDQGK